MASPKIKLECFRIIYNSIIFVEIKYQIDLFIEEKWVILLKN